ncbi:MAG: hypothetical protein KGL39_30480 [Patescibacteria group bacterium]|nr:hypothetical protein [Patescibacteria group bacterium]
MSYLDDSVKALGGFEGCVPWMYLDTRGFVTVGVGNMLPIVEAATALPFQYNGTGATQDQIASDYFRVKGMAAGRLPKFYACSTSVTLTQEEIQLLLYRRLPEFEQGLRQLYPGYDTFPDAAKLGLIDMAYNLGVYGLANNYPKFNAAVRAQDWATAATECHRNGPSQERNDWTAGQFNLAATGSIDA